MKRDLIIVLYGSTGDLSFRKLFPAIVELKKKELLPQKTIVISVGRRDFSNEEFLEFLKENNKDIDIDVLKDLTIYHKMQITDNNDYEDLASLINNYRFKTSRIIHYLSVAPEYMLDVAKYISTNDIVVNDDNYSSLIFEKPFGVDYKSASLLNKQLWNYYDESQIYRMDHYLGKSMLSNLIEIRFSNSVFSQILSFDNINSIDLIVKEEVGILNRGSFYDKTGASKDMFQSHILQIISLLLMDKPNLANSTSIINKKVQVINSLIFEDKSLTFGQYSGYLDESNILDNSLTETLLSVRLTTKKLKNKFYVNVLTGKKMSNKETKIRYHLKDNSTLEISIYPKESISIKTSVDNKEIIFNYDFEKGLDEYSHLLLSAINNQKEMFVRWDEIEKSWIFVDKLLTKKKELVIYTNELVK